MVTGPDRQPVSECKNVGQLAQLSLRPVAQVIKILQQVELHCVEIQIDKIKAEKIQKNSKNFKLIELKQISQIKDFVQYFATLKNFDHIIITDDDKSRAFSAALYLRKLGFSQAQFLG